jgi:2-haloacid dehalogenase
MHDPITATDQPVIPDGLRRPALLVFDVNETLSDMTPVGRRFEDLGLPASLAKTWFASLLRDGFAVTAAGGMEKFADLGSEGLRVMLEGQQIDRDLEEAVEHVMGGFAELGVHPDVPDGLRALDELGIRLVTLSNGAASVAERLLGDAGVLDHLDALLSVEDAGVWKPARGAYAYALEKCRVEAENAMLVAVHPWDTHGAREAGLAAAWLNRSAGRYPRYFARPDLEATSLTDLAEKLR